MIGSTVQREQQLWQQRPQPDPTKYTTLNKADRAALREQLQEWNLLFAESLEHGDWGDSIIDTAYEVAWQTNYTARIAVGAISNDSMSSNNAAESRSSVAQVFAGERAAQLISVRDANGIAAAMMQGGAMHIILNGIAGRPKATRAKRPQSEEQQPQRSDASADNRAMEDADQDEEVEVELDVSSEVLSTDIAGVVYDAMEIFRTTPQRERQRTARKKSRRTSCAP